MRHHSHLQAGEPRTGIVNRFEKQQCNHLLSEEPGIGIVSRLEVQGGIAATYILESQRQAWSTDLKHSKEQQSLTD